MPTRLDEIARLQLRVGVRQQRRGPVFVGDAEPAVGDLEADRLGVVDLLVGIFLQALVAEIADQAFVQDVVAGDLRGAVPRDQRERIKRDRRVADIGDVVLDGEEIAVVDRNGAAEGETVAIVIFQRHRGRSASGCRAPPAARPYSGRESSPSSPRPRPSRTRRNRDLPVPEGEYSTIAGEVGIDGLAELHQRQVVDAARPSAKCCR